jgi:hypothetical protein
MSNGKKDWSLLTHLGILLSYTVVIYSLMSALWTKRILSPPMECLWSLLIILLKTVYISIPSITFWIMLSKWVITLLWFSHARIFLLLHINKFVCLFSCRIYLLSVHFSKPSEIGEDMSICPWWLHWWLTTLFCPHFFWGDGKSWLWTQKWKPLKNENGNSSCFLTLHFFPW